MPDRLPTRRANQILRSQFLRNNFLYEVTKVTPMFKLSVNSFPKLHCIHENCEGHTQEFGLGGAHAYCRATLSDPSVHCGNSKHDLFFEILDKKVNRVCINTQMCFTHGTRAIMKELNEVIVFRTSGLSLDYLTEFLAQFDSLPRDLLDILKINIVIASGPRLFFSKYFRHHFSMIDVCLPVEVKDFLEQEVGNH